MQSLEKFYGIVTDVCLSLYGKTDVGGLADQLLHIDGLPMHCPVHHYIVPATLLTVCRAAQERGIDALKLDLQEALKRALEVPGGFCGYCGCCGASVGVGIFWSILTSSSPMSGASWGIIQSATAEVLAEIAKFGGPRCCKRCTWLALCSALPRINETMHYDLVIPVDVLCNHYKENEDCIRVACPFYPQRGV